jgi:hypothetical protein
MDVYTFIITETRSQKTFIVLDEAPIHDPNASIWCGISEKRIHVSVFYGYSKLKMDTVIWFWTGW